MAVVAQGYIGRNPADSSTVIARQSFSPTGIQTDFTFAAGYEVGYVDLYLNGVRLVEGQDFTATDGSTVGLTTNAVNGDVLEVVAFKAFNASNVSAAAGNFTVGGTLDVTGATTLNAALSVSGNTTVGTGITLDTNGNVNVSGVVTANSFVGDGTQLTGVGGGSVISGITIREEGSVVGTSGTVVNVNFVGPDVTATAQAGFSTITIAAGGKFINFTDGGSTGITTTAKTKIDDDFKVTGVSTFSGNVGINTDVAHHLLTIENAAGAGVANTAILLRNPTTVNDSRIGIDFAINANAYGGSVWDGASIYVANGGVAGVGSIMTATVENGISSTRTYISHEGKIFAHRETWGSDPTSDNHPALDVHTRTTTGNGDTTYATGIDFRVDNVVKKRLAVTKGNGSEGGGDWIFYRDGGSNEALRITSAGNVGVNSTTPGALFTVNTGGTEDAFRVGSPNGSDTIFRLGSTGTDTDTHAVIKYDKDENYLSLLVSGESHGAGGVLIANGGDVGIGTTNPAAKLHLSDTDGPLILNRELDSVNQISFRTLNTHRGSIGANSANCFTVYNSSSAEQIRVGNDGLIGIGNIDPDDYNASADDVVIETSGNTGVSIVSGTSNTGNLFFADGTSGNATFRGYVQYNHTNNELILGANAQVALRINPGGDHEISGIATATQFDATSDIALKENIEVIDEPITKLSELKGVTFDWKKGGHSVGVIAQDVEKVLPTAVGGSKDQKTVNYNAIIGLLVESVKDQQKQIEELKSLLDK